MFVHNPHSTLGKSANRMSYSQTSQDIRLLNINQPIKAIAAGKLDRNSNHDILAVGTPVNLLAYDVQNNKDIFYKEVFGPQSAGVLFFTPQVSEGVNALVVGSLGGFARPLVVAGGNCTLQGFDSEGNDPFWTVTGDSVTSLAILDVDDDGEMEVSLRNHQNFDALRSSWWGLRTLTYEPSKRMTLSAK